jgi:hypothetical protein
MTAFLFGLLSNPDDKDEHVSETSIDFKGLHGVMSQEIECSEIIRKNV